MSAAPSDGPGGDSAGNGVAGEEGDRYLRSTVKHGLVYGLGSILTKAIGFVMLPVYTRVLTPADYGILEILTMTTDVIAMVVGAGLTWAVTRYYYYYDAPEEKHAVVSSAAILLVASFGVSSLVTLPFSGALSTLLLGSGSHADLVRLAIAAFFLTSLIEVPMAFLRARQESVHVVAVGVARFTLALGLNILFLIGLGMGVDGILYSTILASAAAGGYLVTTTLRETGLRFSRPVARKLVAYGLPLIATNLGSFALHQSDRYFLRAFDSLESVGLYSLGYKFAMLMSLLVATPFARIWSPKALEIEDAEGDGGRPVLRRILYGYNLVLVASGLGIALFAGDVIRLMAAPEFHGAAAMVPLLCLGMLFFGYRQVAYVGPTIRERSDLIARGTAVGAAVVLAANFALIPRWGPLGAALATLLAFGSEFAVVMAHSERVYPLGLSLGRLFRPVAVAVTLYGAVALGLPDGPSPWLSVPAKLAALTAFGGLLVVTGDLPRPRLAAVASLARDPVGEVRAWLGG